MPDNPEIKALVIDWQARYYKHEREFAEYKKRMAEDARRDRELLHQLAVNYEEHIHQHHGSIASYLIEQAAIELELI